MQRAGAAPVASTVGNNSASQKAAAMAAAAALSKKLGLPMGAAAAAAQQRARTRSPGRDRRRSRSRSIDRCIHLACFARSTAQSSTSIECCQQALACGISFCSNMRRRQNARRVGAWKPLQQLFLSSHKAMGHATVPICQKGWCCGRLVPVGGQEAMLCADAVRWPLQAAAQG